MTDEKTTLETHTQREQRLRSKYTREAREIASTLEKHLGESVTHYLRAMITNCLIGAHLEGMSEQRETEFDFINTHILDQKSDET